MAVFPKTASVSFTAKPPWTIARVTGRFDRSGTGLRCSPRWVAGSVVVLGIDMEAVLVSCAQSLFLAK